VDKSRRRIVEGWIDKARNQLQVAKDHLESRTRESEAIEASQECIELSVKAILSMLNIEYPRKHWWDQEKKDLDDIAKQIQQRQLQERLAAQYLDHIIHLPRLLFLVNFWAQFYTTAKYGFHVQDLAPAQDLFKKQEAELAVQHAEECYRAASKLRCLDKDRLAAILHK
jgi:HEPN domain-containing protein